MALRTLEGRPRDRSFELTARRRKEDNGAVAGGCFVSCRGVTANQSLKVKPPKASRPCAGTGGDASAPPDETESDPATSACGLRLDCLFTSAEAARPCKAIPAALWDSDRDLNRRVKVSDGPQSRFAGLLQRPQSGRASIFSDAWAFPGRHCLRTRRAICPPTSFGH